jgi:hypothetical protein
LDPPITDASLDSPPGDSSTDSSTEAEAGTSHDATSDVPPDRYLPPRGCTADQACRYPEICVGDNCLDTWECFSHHRDPVLEHPCPAELQAYCGCDGVTFEAYNTCPDRPFLHVGECGDGATCDGYDATCDTPPPLCPEGQLPSIAGDCWGDCVPLETCRCEYNWECPGYRCSFDERRCAPLEPTDAGDAG